MAILLICLSMTAFGGEMDLEDLPTTHFSRLNGENEVPEVDTDAVGAATFSYNPTTRTLSYIIGHTLADATAAHIHGPANEGENGGVVFDFGDPSSPMTGSFTLTPEQQDDLFDGLYYVNIHSPANPGGEIRGQIRDVNSLSTKLSGDQEVPPVTTDARGLASVFYDSSTRVLRVYVVHTLLNSVTGAHIHGPAQPGESGGVVFPLDVGLVSVTGEFTLSESQESDLLAGLYYINIHTDAFPGGELRGQIEPELYLVGFMSGLQEFPPNTSDAVGAFVARYNPGTSILDYVITHDVEAATAIHIHEAPAGSNGGVIFNLGDPTPPVIGEVSPSSKEVETMINAGFYINIHSPTFPGGEIRGQMRTMANVHAMTAEYFDILTGWATEAVSNCFGQEVDITVLVEFLNNDLTCPQ